MEMRHNLLIEPCISTTPAGQLTLPGVLAALARDDIDSFPALRPHQEMFWHMFCVQLGAIALHRGGRKDIPRDEESWRDLLRGLTPEFPGDEPWSVLVEDDTKPAFMQPPVPDGSSVDMPVETPDSLDLLITAKNHDLKQQRARSGAAEDWLFALVTLQTGEGFGGAGNYGVARMNGGSSSRPMMTLAPLDQARPKHTMPRLGTWFRREVNRLLRWRQGEADNSPFAYDWRAGAALLWLMPWADGDQLHMGQLDPWFIEVCRRVRFRKAGDGLAAVRGTSKAARVDLKAQKGAVGDPWAPVHKTENKSLTLNDGDFDYSRVVDLLGGDWVQPLLSQVDPDQDTGTLALVFAAISRGNSKTEGLKQRVIPIKGQTAKLLGPKKDELHQLANAQVATIEVFQKALKYALVMVAAKGERSGIKRGHYAFVGEPSAALDRYADEIFFLHLWARFDAEDGSAEDRHAADLAFAQALWTRTERIFNDALPTMPCPSLLRPRAEARARRALRSKDLRDRFPELFSRSPELEDATDDL